MVKKLRHAIRATLASPPILGSVRGMRRLARRGGLRIVNFHRVLPDDLPADDYRRSMFPTASQFESIIAHLTRRYDVVPLACCLDLDRIQREGRVKVAITFDDGYRDNMTCALPVLRTYNAPAALFVSTAAMRGTPLWFQRIYVLVAGLSAGTIRTAWDGREFSLADRAQTADAIASGLKGTHIDQAEQHVDSLWRLYGGQAVMKDCSVTEAMLTEEEVRALAGESLLTIGSHTVRHPNLTLLNDDELKRELRDSRDAIASLTEKEDLILAYPNGRFDERVEQAARDAGYVAALTMRSGLNKAGTGRFRLFRDYLANSGEDIDLHIEGVLHSLRRITGVGH